MRVGLYVGFMCVYVYASYCIHLSKGQKRETGQLMEIVQYYTVHLLYMALVERLKGGGDEYTIL